MVVYADVLMVLNLIVDYFLLKISSKFLNLAPKTWRLLSASLIGAIFSLYIFLPQSSFFTELAVRIAMNSVMTFVCFGFRNLKYFLKAMGTLFIITCLYAGAMIAVWQIMRPKNMIINNSVVYFNISPVILVLTTVAAYFIYMLIYKIFASSSKFAQRCEITIFADGKSVSASAIIDTGNSVSDVFGKSEIIIADRAVVVSLFGDLDIVRNDLLQMRYRAVPCGTVSGGGILDGFRCDSVKIVYENQNIIVEKPILAVSKTPLSENYSAILNPKILNMIGDKNAQTEKLFV
ncbi:MAG: sigma-E processing peptidase SpoIIGA [Acutalibacteraceae bacterium]|jgi:stage II sporulation protein GA (sporulation sigma-E factor processing peptidase)